MNRGNGGNAAKRAEKRGGDAASGFGLQSADRIGVCGEWREG